MQLNFLVNYDKFSCLLKFSLHVMAAPEQEKNLSKDEKLV